MRRGSRDEDEEWEVYLVNSLSSSFERVSLVLLELELVLTETLVELNKNNITRLKYLYLASILPICPNYIFFNIYKHSLGKPQKKFFSSWPGH